jgi:anti-sigma factor RsiW
MSDCQTIDPLVSPFVDGELADRDRRLVEDHLRACPPCDSRVRAEQTVHTLIRARAAALTPPAPEPLRARCRALAACTHAGTDSRAAAAPPPGPPSGRLPVPDAIAARRAWSPRLAPYAAAASLMIVVGSAFVYQATDQSVRVLAAELTADHVKCLAMNRAFGTHQSPAVVEGAMASGFDWPMHLPQDPASADLELVGSRPCLYGEGKVAHIMYRHNGRPVSLFMLPNTSRAEQLVRVLGHEAAIWCVGNRTFVLLARESRPEIERMASYVKASLH